MLLSQNLPARKIRRSQVREFEVHKFCCEASSIGLRAGEWPAAIDTEIGNGRPLHLRRFVEHEGDVAYAVYDQELGCIVLNVWND